MNMQIVLLSGHPLESSNRQITFNFHPFATDVSRFEEHSPATWFVTWICSLQVHTIIYPTGLIELVHINAVKHA